MSHTQNVICTSKNLVTAPPVISLFSNQNPALDAPITHGGKLLLSVNEAAERMGLSRQKLYLDWANGVGVKRVKVGSRTLIRVSDLADWVAALEVQE